MPIYEIACQACGQHGEVLLTSHRDPIRCPHCGGSETRKVMSATSSLTGHSGMTLPGPGDTGCCGNQPGQTNCAGPGSCCGKTIG